MKLVLYGGVLAVFIVFHLTSNVEAGAGATGIYPKPKKTEHCTGELKLMPISPSSPTLK